MISSAVVFLVLRTSEFFDAFHEQQAACFRRRLQRPRRLTAQQQHIAYLQPLGAQPLHTLLTLMLQPHHLDAKAPIEHDLAHRVAHHL